MLGFFIKILLSDEILNLKVAVFSNVYFPLLVSPMGIFEMFGYINVVFMFSMGNFLFFEFLWNCVYLVIPTGVWF